jgi:adenylylsulfate kinase
MAPERVVTRRRSLVKALTYRAFAFCLDFLVIYLFTHEVDLAVGFMILSNIYRTVVYFLHERIWARIRWGTELRSA